MRSAMLQCPKSSLKSLLEMQRARPAAVTAQQLRGNHPSDTGEAVGCPSHRGHGTSPSPSFLAKPRPGWGMLDLPSTPCLAEATPAPPPTSSQQPSRQPGAEEWRGRTCASHLLWPLLAGGTLGLRSTRLGCSRGWCVLPGPSHLCQGAAGSRHVGWPGPALPRCPTAGLQLRVPPRRQLPPPWPGLLHVLPSCACE